MLSIQPASTPKVRRAALRSSVIEGVVYAGMVGLGEFWFLPDAVRLGASPLAIAALVTLPQLVGALGALGMLRLLRSARARRPLLVAAVVGQALGLLTLAVLSALGHTTPWLLVAVACLHFAFAQAAGTAWASWFGDVVPPRIRGRWFGGRNRFVHGTTFAGIVVGGLVLGALEPRVADAAGQGGLGYALIFGVAGLLRLVSAVLLARTWEPRFVRPEHEDEVATVLRGPEGAAGRGVVAMGATMLFAVCVASPFFVPYMLDTLRFSYVQYMAAQGVLMVAKVTSLGAWGRLVDRNGAVLAYRVAALLVAIVPLPWIVADRAWIVFAAQALSGIAWGGHEVAMLSLTLAAAPSRKRAVLLTAQSLANGGAQVLGGLAGTALVAMGPGVAAAAFAASGGLRLLVAASAKRGLSGFGPARVRFRDVAARVVGWSAHGGPVRTLMGDGGPKRGETT